MLRKMRKNEKKKKGRKLGKIEQKNEKGGINEGEK